MSTQLTGAAGELFVAAELSRRGWASSITPKGVERTDILAQHVETGYVAALQVKTTTTGTRFTLGEKNEASTEATNEWYVLVGFHSIDATPTYYVLPCNHVAALIYVQHRVWLTKAAKDGTRHKHNSRRTIEAKNIAATEAGWDRLLEPTADMALKLSPYYQEIFDEADILRHTFSVAESGDRVRLERSAERGSCLPRSVPLSASLGATGGLPLPLPLSMRRGSRPGLRAAESADRWGAVIVLLWAAATAMYSECPMGLRASDHGLVWPGGRAASMSRTDSRSDRGYTALVTGAIGSSRRL